MSFGSLLRLKTVQAISKSLLIGMNTDNDVNSLSISRTNCVSRLSWGNY